VKGPVPQDCPLLLQMPVANPGCYLCFSPFSLKLEIPITPAVGSINLLEPLVELRKPITYGVTGLLQRILKDTNEWPDEEILRVRS